MSDTTFGDRYQSVGLDRNPFTAPGLGAPACAAFVSRGIPNPPPAWSRALVQVVGDSGFGKTSQLEQWRSAAPGPYHYIPRRPIRERWSRAPLAAQSNGVIYGDEIDRMPRPVRRRWFSQLATHNVTLIIGTHVDLSRLGRRTGFDVITHQLRPFDRATLQEAIDLRLRSVATGDHIPELFTTTDVDEIFVSSGGVPEEADVICHGLLAQRVR